MTAAPLTQRLGVSLPAVAAPMAGGPTTPELVTAAAVAGSMGFLAGGYLTAQQLKDQITQVRAEGTPLFGVNLFAPNPVPISDHDYRAYAELLAPWARRYGVELAPGEPRTDDDHWSAKITMLVQARVPVVSVTFGLIPAEDLARLQACGTVVLQTVTDLDEAVAATDAGVDGLVVQSAAAGGHSGCWSPPSKTPLRETADAFTTAALVSEVRAVSDKPLWAAGGITAPVHLAAVLDAGAEAAVVGTVLLCTEEAGTGAAYRSALLGRTSSGAATSETTVTTAFSGRPARALRTEFTEMFTAEAPLGFPAVHYLTAPVRRAAALSHDAQGINLWAGAGFREVSERPAGEVLRHISGVGNPG